MAIGGYTGIVTDGLVFNIDAYNTKSFVSGDTVANDLVGGLTGGTLTAGVTFDTNAWGFDGSGDGIDFGSSINVQSITKTTGMSAEMWINFNSVGTPFAFTTHSKDGGNDGGFLLTYFNTTGLIFQIKDVNGKRVDRRATDITLETGTWYHLAGTISGATSPTQATTSLYLDGVLYTGSITGNDETFTGDMTHPSLIVGARDLGAGPVNVINGDISIAKIYNRELSATEIKQNYDATKWRFK